MILVKIWWLWLLGIIYLTDLITADEPTIVIIGAGPAGIAAASKLFEHDFHNVTVLEAEDRIGGRVYSTLFDDSWIDLGAQNVHGVYGNIAFEMASPLELLEIPSGPELNAYVYSSNGHEIPRSLMRDLLDSFERFDLEFGDLVMLNETSAGDYFTRMLGNEFEKYPTINETLAKQLMLLFEKVTMASDASDTWWNVSIRGYLEFWDCPGSRIVNWKDRAYGTILDILVKKYPNPEEELPVFNNTLLNSEVVNINYQSVEGKAVIETSTGQKYVADHVIVTPSLGVLKAQYETLFTPQLPESKVKAIQGLAYGSVAKIYLSYDTPWWGSDFPGAALIWEENDKKEYESDPDRSWLPGIDGFFLVAHRPRLLLAWMSGAHARHMETFSEDQVLNQTFALLEKFLGQTYNITRPTRIIRSTWYSNKHFRGTYSYRSLASESPAVWPADLTEPVLVNEKPVLMFAGEATNDHHSSTVHGAIETGFREANRLIEMYNETKNTQDV